MGRRAAIVIPLTLPEPAIPPGRRPQHQGRRDRRLLLGAAAVFSVSEAASLLPLSDADARDWIRERGLVRLLAGKPVVRWGDVLDALEPDQTLPRQEHRRAGCNRIPRSPLRPFPLRKIG